MWAIIKALFTYFVLRFIFGFITAMICLNAIGNKVPMENLVAFATKTDHWSFWVSLIVAIIVLVKSW